MTLYLISGLGVDRRAFQRLQFPEGLTVTPLDWIDPRPGESLAQYAKRLAGGIDSTGPVVLLGLSFGGMVATEIAKVVPVRGVILLSSVATPAELPLLYRLAGALRLHRLVPARLLTYSTALTDWFFGAETAAEQRLLRDILRDTSPDFLRWALHSLLTWTASDPPHALFRIHGSKDRMLPVSKIPADRIVRGAGHLMVFSHGREANSSIRDGLERF